MRITKAMLEQLPPRQPRTDGGQDLPFAIRELSTLRGLLSAIQTRCQQVMDRAGELGVDYKTPQGEEVLGEHMWAVMINCQLEQIRLLAITNQLRERAGMKLVEKGKTHEHVQGLFDELMSDLKAELEDICRRSGGTFAPSHASVRRDERPPSTTRRSECDGI